MISAQRSWTIRSPAQDQQQETTAQRVSLLEGRVEALERAMESAFRNHETTVPHTSVVPPATIGMTAAAKPRAEPVPVPAPEPAVAPAPATETAVAPAPATEPEPEPEPVSAVLDLETDRDSGSEQGFDSPRVR